MIIPLFKWIARKDISGTHESNFFWFSKAKHVLVLVGWSPEYIKGTYEIKIDHKSKVKGEFEGNFLHTIPLGKGKVGTEFWFEFGQKTEVGAWQVTGILTDEIQSKKDFSEFALDTSDEATSAIGQILLSDERYNEAIWLLKEYCFHNSDAVVAYFWLGKSLVQAGFSDDAKRYLDYAKQLEEKVCSKKYNEPNLPTDFDINSYMERAKSLTKQSNEKEVMEVLTPLETWFSKYENSITPLRQNAVLMFLAELKAQIKEWDDSIAYFRKVLENEVTRYFPADIALSVMESIYEVQIMANRHDDALETASLILDYSSESREVLRIKGRLLLNLNRIDESIEYLNKAYEMDKSDPQSYLLLMNAFERKADEIREPKEKDRT